ncbi:hypothetical protein Salat_0726700 [Sesamum alatum]|uniref:Uncharacterized protein n=1 Tax=Sesamum alatum TaxID=300844 RepID=A0AAE2CV36_9LAMI|nr:hypothetical protein Salat_0726700 [Sesamum alatum]
MPWKWDPFDVANDLPWIKFWLLAIFLFIFSFVFIGIPLTPPSNLRYIQVEIKSFSASLLACFLASLFFPQLFFWYVYPVVLLSFLCHICIFNVFRNFTYWVQVTSSLMPNMSILITTAINPVEANRELHEDEAQLDHGSNLEEAGRIQV